MKPEIRSCRLASESAVNSPSQTVLTAVLASALDELCLKYGLTLFTAHIANLVQSKLRVELCDNKLVLSGHLFGPALFPDLPPDMYGTLRFRDFLLKFPELVELV